MKRELRYLVVVYAAISLMATVFVVVDLWLYRLREINSTETLAMTYVQLLRTSVDDIVRMTEESLAVVAAGSAPSAVNSAQRLQDELLFSSHIANGGVYDASGVLSTPLRPGSPRPPAELPDEVTRAHTGSLSTTQIFTGIDDAGEGTIGISRRLESGHILFACIPGKYIAETFRLSLGSGIWASLYTRDGVELAAWPDPRADSRAYFIRTKAEEGRTLAVDSRDGTVFALMQLRTHPFFVVLTFDSDYVLGAWKRGLWWRIVYLALGHAVLAILFVQIHRRNTQEAMLRSQEMVVRETNHRVKNHLGILEGLLSLSADSIEDSRARETVLAFRGRIRSIALVHELLYGNARMSSLPFDEYCRSLVRQLASGWGERELSERVELDIQPIVLGVDMVRRLGLIIHELITNAYKYAYRPAEDKKELKIKISFRLSAKRWSLTVSDNGPGFADGSEQSAGDGIGLTVVRALAEELDGEFSRWSEDGACVRVSGDAAILQAGATENALPR